MYSEDRVLVGVLRRKSDLQYLLQQGWYRIPQRQMPRGVYAEYLAFYLSGTAARAHGSSGIGLYAQRSGIELCYRRDLLPHEADHPNANEAYYRVAVTALKHRVPPILNPTRRSISFILTTWDRFIRAEQIADLYSKADYFVDRVYHALREAHVRSHLYWEAERPRTGFPAQVRILCEDGVVVASSEAGAGVDVVVDGHLNVDEIVACLRALIAQRGGVLRTT